MAIHMGKVVRIINKKIQEKIIRNYQGEVDRVQ